MLFERYVNSKDNQTGSPVRLNDLLFERYVNSKDNQTESVPEKESKSLRDM